jgi:DNA invertase Pin-like site-specific DNA recombinase
MTFPMGLKKLEDRVIAQKRVAIYARVSTVDKGQDPETQLLALREYAARRGFLCVGEYVEYASDPLNFD